MPPPSSSSTADVVVIGGGVVGCALTYQLANRGIPVTLVERDSLGEHSSGRNAGGVRQQFSSEVTVRMQMLSFELLERFEDEVGIPAGLKRIGYLFALDNEPDASEFREYLEMWRRLGVRGAQWVDPEKIAELSPALNVGDLVGGTYCPSDGIASPAEVTYGYASRARALGADIREGCEVVAIRTTGDRISGVSTPVGDIACEAVFICAGAWSSDLGRLVGIDVPVQPHRRQIFLTGPVAGVARDSPMTVDYSTSFYFHAEGEGALIGMSDPLSEPTFDTGTDWTFLEEIFDVVRRRAPSFEDAEVRTGWAGLYEITPDNQPILGPVEGVAGLWCACGFSGHGFMQAPATGLLLAQAFAGEVPELDLGCFGHGRFASGVLTPERAVI